MLAQKQAVMQCDNGRCQLVHKKNISQGSVATLLRGGGISIDSFITNFTGEPRSERILKIGQHLAKLRAIV